MTIKIPTTLMGVLRSAKLSLDSHVQNLLLSARNVQTVFSKKQKDVMTRTVMTRMDAAQLAK